MRLKNFRIIGLSLVFLASSVAHATSGSPGLPLPSAVKQRLNNSSTVPALVQLGTQITDKKIQVMKAVWDFSVLGGASGATVVLKDATGGQAVLPINAIIKQVATQEITNITGAGTISLGINSTSDLLTATSLATFSGIQAGTPTGIAADMVKATATSAVTATFDGGTTTAGKLNVFLEYYLNGS